MAATFNYSIIKVTPDHFRGETLNIGVALFLDGAVSVHISGNLSKLKAVDPTFDTSLLDDFKNAIEGLNAMGVGQEYILASICRPGQIYATKMGTIRAAQGTTPNSVISRLLATHVNPKSGSDSRALRGSRLTTKLKEEFKILNILGESSDDIANHKVVPQFPISMAEDLFADFVLKNGAWRVTETIDFRSNPDRIRTTKRGEAALKTLTLEKAGRKFGNNFIPVVVYAANPNTMDLVQPSLNILSGHCDRMFDMSDPEDMRSYFAMMVEAARSAPLAALTN